MKNKSWIYTPGLVVLLLLVSGIISEISAQRKGGTVIDVDGNQYNTVTIGRQEWMADNLKTTKYNDRTDISNVTDMSQWVKKTVPAYSWYDNDNSNKDVYGALYNWYSVNTGKLCPVGWRIPTDADWDMLTGFLGGTDSAGGKLKEKGISYWNPPNLDASNENGFAALPGGYRFGNYWYSGKFYEKGINGYWWSDTECTDSHSWSRTMHTGNAKVYRSFFSKNTGFSVRCIKDY